jgi:predicted ABC-type ATPase
VSRLIVYAGPNGAGKSTLRDIGDDLVEVVIDPDRIAREIARQATSAIQIEAGRAAIKLFRRSVSEGRTISLETTLSGQTILLRMAEAKRAGYLVELRYVALTSAEIHISRVEQRVLKGGHDIPPETIIRRFADSLDNLPKALQIAHKATVIDNSDTEKRFLLRAERGVILQLDPNPPRWFQSRWPEIQSALATHTGGAG